MNTTTEIDVRRGATSASNANADLLCPGRHLAQKGIQPGPPSEDAIHGRKIHEALADSGSQAKLTALNREQRDIFDSIREIEKKVIAQFFGDDKTPKRVFREQRLWCMVDKKWEHSGQPDTVVRAGPRGLILEYKTLAGDIPDSPQNMQLRDQVALTAGSYLLNEIGTAVIQPLATHDPVVAVYDAASIKRAQQEMFERVRRSNDPNSLRVPGKLQCQFCLATHKCKEYSVWVSTMLPNKVSLPSIPVAEWTADQRFIFCERYKLVRKWLDDCENQIRDLLEKNPEAVPGWKLKPGSFRDTITDPQVVFSRFIKLALDRTTSDDGLAAQQQANELFMKCVKVGKGELSNQLAVLTGLKGKELKGMLESLIKDAVSQKQDRPSLSRDSEPTKEKEQT